MAAEASQCAFSAFESEVDFCPAERNFNNCTENGASDEFGSNVIRIKVITSQGCVQDPMFNFLSSNITIIYRPQYSMISL